jgi:hypothetical protein
MGLANYILTTTEFMKASSGIISLKGMANGTKTEIMNLAELLMGLTKWLGTSVPRNGSLVQKTRSYMTHTITVAASKHETMIRQGSIRT